MRTRRKHSHPRIPPRPRPRRSGGSCVETLESRLLLAAVPVPQSGELLVSAPNPVARFGAGIAADADGDFVVVWQSYQQEGPTWNVYARRFAADGTPRGDEFRVNQAVGEDAGSQRFEPSVAMDADGDFLVVWEQWGYGQADIYARRYSADGAPAGDDFQVNSTGFGNQREPAVVMNGAGDAVVTWTGSQGEGEFSEIYAQVYRPDGEAIGGEFRVNADTSGFQGESDVAVGADGGFAVAWVGPGPNRTGHIWARAFYSDGDARTDDVPITTAEEVNANEPAIAAGPAGDFDIAWEGDGPEGAGVLVRRFSASGTDLGPAFLGIDRRAGSDGATVSGIATDADGNFLVVGDCAFDGSDQGVAGKFFDATGQSRGGEFRINARTDGPQTGPSVAIGAGGNAVVAWQSPGEGIGGGIYARRYKIAEPPPPAHVVARQVFYNASGFDGRDPAAGGADDAAIASNKRPLLPGAAATFASVTSYDKGINGVMIDVAGVPIGNVLSADDFSFRRGRDPDRDFWFPGPRPATVTVRPGAGANGSDRVTLTWPAYDPLRDGVGVGGNRAVGNAWLEVTMRAGGNTALAQNDVFVYGNLVGETGDRPTGTTPFRVNAADLGAVKRFLNAAAAVDSDSDVNRDGRINALDLGVLKRNLNASLAIPVAVPVPLAAASVAMTTLREEREVKDLLP